MIWHERKRPLTIMDKTRNVRYSKLGSVVEMRVDNADCNISILGVKQ